MDIFEKHMQPNLYHEENRESWVSVPSPAWGSIATVLRPLLVLLIVPATLVSVVCAVYLVDC